MVILFLTFCFSIFCFVRKGQDQKRRRQQNKKKRGFQLFLESKKTLCSPKRDTALLPWTENQTEKSGCGELKKKNKNVDMGLQ